MRDAGRVIYDALTDSYYAFGALVAWNILWVLGTVLLITAPPAMAAMCYAAHQLARQEPVTWRTFFEGFRKHFWLGWRWGLINVLVIALLISNGQFYSQFDTNWSGWIRGAFLGLFLLWLMIQVYVFPLLFEQERRSLLLALRNSVVLWLRYPGFSLSLLAFLIFLAVISSLLLQPAWLVITVSLGAYLASRGVLHLVGGDQSPDARET